MVNIVKIINGQKKLIPLTSDVGSGVPLGTLVAFSDDTPKDGYVQMGTTFDETKYPMLYAMTGSNVLPAMFDHNRPSALQRATDLDIPNSAYNVNWTATVDGIAYIDLLNPTGSGGTGLIRVWDITDGNNVLIANWYYTSNTSDTQFSFEFINGHTYNIVRTGGGLNLAGTAYAIYYTHPLFIKATSGLSENQQENVLNTLNNNLSYSTEEHATGRKWLDGKMIYEKSFYAKNITATTTVSLGNIANLDTPIKVEGWQYNTDGFWLGLGYSGSADFNTYIDAQGNFKISGYAMTGYSISIFYTKTT